MRYPSTMITTKVHGKTMLWLNPALTYEAAKIPAEMIPLMEKLSRETLKEGTPLRQTVICMLACRNLARNLGVGLLIPTHQEDMDGLWKAVMKGDPEEFWTKALIERAQVVLIEAGLLEANPEVHLPGEDEVPTKPGVQ